MDIPTLSVVLPIYNEGTQLKTNITTLLETLNDIDSEYEVILVDDGSVDDSWSTILGVCEIWSQCTALRLSRNFGKEAAVLAGLAKTRGNVVVVMDADLQHPPELIREMLEAWKTGDYEVVDAVKTLRGKESLVYKFFVFIFNLLICRLSGFELSNSSDFKLLDRKAVNAILALSERQTFYRGLTEWVGFRHKRIEMKVQDRSNGASTFNYVRLFKLALIGLTSFSTIALQLVTLIGVGFLVFSVCFSAYSLYFWWVGESLKGFPTVILLQLITGSVLMIGQGVIGIYISNIYTEVKMRPRYFVLEESPKIEPKTQE